MTKFLILGNNNAITYKEVFPHIKDGEMWLGFSANKTFKFKLSDSYEKWDEMDEQGNKYCKVTAITWFTNIPHNKNQEPLQLTKTYNPTDYPKYDNYDAIEVSKVKDIPIDYDGVMGVPISFLDKYCNSQFEIVDAREIALNDKQKNKTTCLIKDADSSINGKPTYARICIKKNAEFEIVKFRKGNDDKDLSINGYTPYFRILIKKNAEFKIVGITQRNDDPYKIKKYTKEEYENANDLNARGTIIVNGIPKSIYARILIKRIK